jgi:RNA polymerase sigma-70 factor, ECF subfamily
MIEDTTVVAGEAILNGVTADRVKDDREESSRATADAAVDALVREHARLVYRIVYTVLRRHHDAEDATQETFVRVLRYRARLDQVKNKKTWLARIAWRVALDRGRKIKSKQEIALDDPDKPLAEPPSTQISADDNLQGAQVSATLDKLIAALPAKLREPLLLSAIQEMSPPEVAGTLGISEAAVRSRLFRARQILKERLALQAVRK